MPVVGSNDHACVTNIGEAPHQRLNAAYPSTAVGRGFMSEQPPVSAKQRRLHTYGRLDVARPLSLSPTSTNQLQDVFSWAKRNQRSVSLTAGLHSFDSQPLNDDVAINLLELNEIKDIDETQHRITAEGGTRWEHIVEKLTPKGLTPHIVVTTDKATIGGTLSGNCLSRSSPISGKEGKFVERFRLLTPEGQILECSRTANADVFRAVIGGFGFLGIVLEATYNLRHIGSETQVETATETYDSGPDLINALVEATNNPAGWDAVYSTAFQAKDAVKGILFRSRYTSRTDMNRLLIYRPKNILNIPVQLLARFSWINNFAWNLIHKGINKNSPYIDQLAGYHFFMDGHRKAKEFAELFGFPAPTIQQTFVMPTETVLEFFMHLDGTLREQGLAPNLFDVLYVPADDFLMSSNNGLAGFAVSVAFDDLSKRRIKRLRELLIKLTDRCEALGGRVYLVKNVHATSEQLGRMYGHAIPEFLQMKNRLDPGGILQNGFFNRLVKTHR